MFSEPIFHNGVVGLMKSIYSLAQSQNLQHFSQLKQIRATFRQSTHNNVPDGKMKQGQKRMAKQRI